MEVDGVRTVEVDELQVPGVTSSSEKFEVVLLLKKKEKWPF